MKIGLVDCDNLVPPLDKQYFNYPRMFVTKFEVQDPKLSFGFYSAIEGCYPEKMDECDAYLITGSKTGVYDDEPWLAGLADFIRMVYEGEVPLIGICFGHQMIAHTLGGRAEKSSKGWGLGAKSYPIVSPRSWMGKDYPESFKLLYSHQDQVTALPDGASVLAKNEFCEHAAFVIDKRVLGIQGHPEFPREYLKELMIMRRERYPAEIYDEAFDSLSHETDSELVIRWIINFLNEGLEK